MEAHMVSQTIKYSDGTETVINYRGKVVNGVLIPNEEIKMDEEVKPIEPAEVAPPIEEAPAEVLASEEASEELEEKLVE